MAIHKCSGCGHILFDLVPENCPVCTSTKDKFNRNDTIFKESMEKSPEAPIKHIPIVTFSKECTLIGGSCIDVTIKVGEVAHPMEDKHYIQFIDCYVDDKHYVRLHLTPSVFAAGSIHLKTGGVNFKAVESCNIHGYWFTEVNL